MPTIWPDFAQLKSVSKLCELTVTSCQMSINNHMHARTHAHTFHGSLDFVRDNPGEPVPEEIFTHSHLSWSSIILYLLPSSITIHGILSVQFTCLTVFFHSLSPSFIWSTSWPGTLHFILRTFLHPIFVFFINRYSLSLQSSALEQVLDILMDILSWEIAEVVSPCLPRSL